LTIELVFERTGGDGDGTQFPGADEVEDLRGGRKGGREGGVVNDNSSACMCIEKAF